MCELFAMSSRTPSTVTYSMDEFARHGGHSYGNKSGWGIAYFMDHEAMVIKEPEPASGSAWVKFIAGQEIKSRFVIAHVRLATIGEPSLMNTHPFRRALGGRAHVFAHNGTLKGLRDDYNGATLNFQPIGDTDSELAFCLLMQRMQPLWQDSDNPPSFKKRLEVFAEFASEMRYRGPSNFLYCDGEVLLAHADRRIYEENGTFSKPRAPGLSMRNCVICQQGPEWSCDGMKIELGDQRTTLIASVPLDAHGWEPLPEGVAIGLAQGVEFSRITT